MPGPLGPFVAGFARQGPAVATLSVFVEPLIRIARVPLVYRPPGGMPDVAPLPALRNGHVTFGSFTRTARITERVVSVWSRILQAVPGSRLVLNSKPMVPPEYLYGLCSSVAFMEAFASRVTGTSGSHQRVKPRLGFSPPAAGQALFSPLYFE